MVAALVYIGIKAIIAAGSKTEVTTPSIEYISREGSRLSDLFVQASTYAKAIPTVYGSIRVAGNIIWSRPIAEHATDTVETRDSGGNHRVQTTIRLYNYTASLAIAICRGPITGITKAWADAKQIDISGANYTIYLGDESQLPDAFMSSFHPVGETPAYRGLAYVVIKDFPLADYGDRIPTFTFEVQRVGVSVAAGESNSLEHKIKSIALGLGVGEYLYDTVIQEKAVGDIVNGAFAQNGLATKINQNNLSSKADVIVSLDDLKMTAPNVEWVSLPVYWFLDIRAGRDIKPGVELDKQSRITPDVWKVGSYSIDTAHKITASGTKAKHTSFGTPSDASIVRIVQELKNRGYKVMLYPKLLVYNSDKHLFEEDIHPGAIRPNMGGNMEVFFNSESGYNNFILHYANLLKDNIDAFVFGGRALTAIAAYRYSNSGEFIAVPYIKNLAAAVKANLQNAKVIYSAYSHHYHSHKGIYYLDDLWADPNIDAVGVEPYWPLTDEEPNDITYKKIFDGWESGEGWTYGYSDTNRKDKTFFTNSQAWKNIKHWWSNEHRYSDGHATAWKPKMKPVWFTEIACGSVDGCTNQPEVFSDLVLKNYPRKSRGRVDLVSQYTALDASVDYINQANTEEPFIERVFISHWDARPSPFYPELGDTWVVPHNQQKDASLSGKLGKIKLATVVEDLLFSVGYQKHELNTYELTDIVRGFAIGGRESVRSTLEMLSTAYFFDMVESNGVLKFVKRGVDSKATIDSSECIAINSTHNNVNAADSANGFVIIRMQELELPKQLDVSYLSERVNFEPLIASSTRSTSNAIDQLTMNMPLVLSQTEAQRIADATMANVWQSRMQYRFTLPPKYRCLEPTDVITINKRVEYVDASDQGSHAGIEEKHIMRIVSTKGMTNGMQEILAVAEDTSSYDFYSEIEIQRPKLTIDPPLPKTELMLLDLPAIGTTNSQEAKLGYAVICKAEGWTGAAVFATDSEIDSDYDYKFKTNVEATVGTVLGKLEPGPHCTWDKHNEIVVSLINGELASATEQSVLRGANLCLIGDELVQFQYAIMVDTNKYRLSKLLRGRKGTEQYINSHQPNERFILLDNAITKETVPPALFGLSRSYKAVTLGDFITSADEIKFKYEAVSLKPYAPCHIRGTRDKDGNITISWKRRTRINGDWLNKIDAPLSEEKELYEIDILGESQKTKRTLEDIHVTYYYIYSRKSDAGFW